MDAGEESEDPILLSPRSPKVAEKGKGKGVKRSQSPSTSGDDDGERKRPKLDKDAARAIFGGTRVNLKPLPSQPSITTTTNDDGQLRSPDRRATSVPPERESPQHADLAKVLSPKRKKTSPVRAKYTSEPADVRDLEMECDEGGGDEGGSGCEVVVPSTPTPAPRANMEALYKARKRVRSYSHLLYFILLLIT